MDADPLFLDPMNGNFALQEESPCIDAGIFIGKPYYGDAPDMGAFERKQAGLQSGVVFVRADAPEGGNGRSWDSAFKQVQEAIDMAESNEEIWIAEGPYYESITLKAGQSLYGGFRGDESMRWGRDSSKYMTLIDGSTSSGSVVIGAEGVLLDGMILTGGNAEKGGGLLIENAEMMVSNCTLRQNEAEQGGGVFVDNGECHFFNTIILGNNAETGGGVYLLQSAADFANCLLVKNRALDGGAIFGDSSSSTLINCTLTENKLEFFYHSIFDFMSTITAISIFFTLPRDRRLC